MALHHDWRSASTRDIPLYFAQYEAILVFEKEVFCIPASAMV